MSLNRIRKNDTVTVIKGSSAGKTGKVLEVILSKNRAIVEGMRVVKKALRKSQDNPRGGIGEKEASIALSNLMLHCPTCKRAVRIRVIREADNKQRTCRRCRYVFDR